jgi:hypothetical protein
MRWRVARFAIRVWIRLAAERSMQDYRRLEVWRKAHGIAIDVWRVAKTFPRDEDLSTA